MSITRLNIDKTVTTFSYPNQQQLALAIGYQTLIDHYFPHNLPTPYQTEMAIMAIEDTIAMIEKQWQPVKQLITTNQQIRSLVKLAGCDDVLTAIQLESLFNRVADVISGSPKLAQEFPDSLEFVSTLLIVRELMHHLVIEEIKVG